MSIVVFFAFVLGAVSVLAVELLALYWILRRLGRARSGGRSVRSRDGIGNEDEIGVREYAASDASLCRGVEKQGYLWILELEQGWLLEQKSKKELVQVFPVKKFAKIKENDLVLTDSDGSQTLVQLLDCNVQAVSSSALPSRKWMKKYPIRVESKNNIIYNGSKICYLYSETSWEKEAWCRALRLASCLNSEETKWYTQLCKEFHSYLMSLNTEYPLFLKHSSAATLQKDCEEPEISNNKMDGNSSKVRYFFKKIAKKASKFGSDPKFLPMPSSSTSKGERKVGGKNIQDVASSSSIQVTSQPNCPPMHTASCDSTAGDEKFASDEGTVSLNLLFSRVFFDIKGSSTINTFIKDRIQRVLSNMKTASYIGGITCKGLDLGGHPPYLHSIKTLPIDMNEGWAVEVDIEYSGGFLLNIETRLEVCEPEVQKGIVSTIMEPSSAGDATSDILVGLENYSYQLNNATESGQVGDQLHEETKPGDVSSQLKSGSWASRWKTILNNVSDHVSQVPISLELRVASLRGTLHLQIKPPPSDQIWIGFTSMPEIELNFTSCIGDHKIASAHVAMLINSRFKAAIQQSLVQPNLESVCIPWMLAEKNDWLPCSAAPFPWIRQENEDLPSKSQQQLMDSKIPSDNSHKDVKNSSFGIMEQFEGVKSVECLFHSLTEADSHPVSSESGTTVADLERQLLGNQENANQNVGASFDITNSQTAMLDEAGSPIDQDAKIKKMGKRDRMLDFRKKMSEKFDEKIRHIEEKGRQIVENVSSVSNISSVSNHSNVSNEIGRISVSSDEIPTGNYCSAVEDSRMDALRLTNEDFRKGASFPDKSNSRTEYLEISKLPSTDSLFEQIPSSLPEEERTKKKTGGKREKVWELGRKMSDKFEEKRRHNLDNVPSESRRTSSSSVDETMTDNGCSIVEDSKNVPHLIDNFQKGSSKTEHLEPCKSPTTGGTPEQIPNSPMWKMKRKTPGRKEKIWDLGRKMSDKLDEKRRHIEEKGRHIVEKFSTPIETKP